MISYWPPMVAEATRLLQQIGAQDLRGCPVLVATESEMCIAPSMTMRAWTRGDLYEKFGRTPAFAMLFSDASIDFHFHHEPHRVRTIAISAAVHELAHPIVEGWIDLWVRTARAACAVSDLVESQREYHGQRFARAATHLFWRAHDLGAPVEITEMLHCVPGLTDASAAAGVLHREHLAYRHLPVGDILRMSAPVGFTRLFVGAAPAPPPEVPRAPAFREIPMLKTPPARTSFRELPRLGTPPMATKPFRTLPMLADRQQWAEDAETKLLESRPAAQPKAPVSPQPARRIESFMMPLSPFNSMWC